MKQQITDFINSYIVNYQARDEIATVYGEPIVGFADARHPYIQNLPKLIGPSHGLPQEVLPDASIIIAYYVPFTKALAKSNRPADRLASPEWARAYLAGDGSGPNSVGSEVCGKCVTGCPCAFWRLK
ncbi:MAG: hypothetical protein Q4A65_07935 [Bacillota bacterium]|nr:hypothetical protein [Bacillota bacterium]